MDGFLMERASRGQRALAGCLAIAILAALILTAPQATAALPAVAPFLPMCGLTVFTTAAIASFLLAAQFQVSRLPVFGLLAGAYAFTALTVAMQLLTFPGLFSPRGLFGAFPTTSGWIWAIWHMGFPSLVLIAMISRRLFVSQSVTQMLPAGRALWLFVGLPLAVGVLLCVTVLAVQLPPALAPATAPGDFSAQGVGVVLLVVNLVALGAVLAIGRLRTVLDLWMAVAVLACVTDTVLSLMSTVRFSLGWYLARLFSMSAPGLLVCVLVWEVSRVYRELTRAHLRLIEYSNRDALTGIFNRRYFNDRFPQDFEQARRSGHPLSLLMVDVDYFKRYNDQYGHPVGDECLEHVALAIMRATHRPADIVARYGGEEFVIVLPETDADGAYFVATRVTESVRALARPAPGPQGVVTVSVGSATHVPRQGDAGDTPERLIALADEALYTAKRLGRDRVHVSEGVAPAADGEGGAAEHVPHANLHA
ncbi:sensor domain-containing diguanylate cyclase [Pandoraea communis]|uniref:diguanylate cyclase n=1 Tax=Pandoraea communis TaxID=2508297 RepID=A0A5E4U259_9BURK|nr:sensor domain-containing diguanylate cyclase [Pandoraea communis]MDM8357785.1 sensor domain-containing diguanylate cyclase [Pandoraea communis]VVD94120.1 diguanylate cyclase [Pandoraea communis]